MQIGPFSVSYDGLSVVTISAQAQTGAQFDSLLAGADRLRSQFKRSQPGSDWGCDGVGYVIQKDALVVRVMRSGVGPRKFKQAAATLKA
jgi:hypothetical protein